MTIREFLKRRTRKLVAVAVFAWLICAMTPLVMHGQEQCRTACKNTLDSIKFPMTIAVGLPLFAGAILGLTFFLNCPRCKGRLGQVAMSLVMPGKTTRRMNFCPYCGVNIDGPFTN
jgi:TRAP-type C4-dicarboxylate transport system permease small subunit